MNGLCSDVTTWDGNARLIEIFRNGGKRAIQLFAADMVVLENSNYIFSLNGNEVASCNSRVCFYKVGAIVNFFMNKNNT